MEFDHRCFLIAAFTLVSCQANPPKEKFKRVDDIDEVYRVVDVLLQAQVTISDSLTHPFR